MLIQRGMSRTELKDDMSVSFDQKCLHPTFYYTKAVNPTHVNMRDCQIYKVIQAF